jgi:hypothetical protein
MIGAGRMIAGALLALLGCEGGRTLTSPLVRVDLRAKLPPRLQRQLAVADTTYECRRPFALSASGATQRFVASYRVLDVGRAKHITAIEVDADGETLGASAPTASAAVDELKLVGGVSVVPLRVIWQASRGCSKASASVVLELRADDAGCKPPPALKLLRPVSP